MANYIWDKYGLQILEWLINNGMFFTLFFQEVFAVMLPLCNPIPITAMADRISVDRI